MEYLSFLLFPACSKCDGEVYNCLKEVKLKTPLGDDIQVVVMACCVDNKYAIANLLKLVNGAFAKQLRCPESLGILAWTGWCLEKLDTNPLIFETEVPAFVHTAVTLELGFSINRNGAIFVSGLVEDYVKYRCSLM